MATWDTQRAEPYTAIGIRRLSCIRCGGQAVFQWQICSDGGNFRPLCKPCDIELNNMVLLFMQHPRRQALMTEYKRTIDTRAGA